MKNPIKKVTKAMAKEIACQFFGHNKAEMINEPQDEPTRFLYDYVFESGKTRVAIEPEWNTRERHSPYITISVQDDNEENEYKLVGDAEFIDSELKTKPYFVDCRELLENLVFCLENAVEDGAVRDKGYLMNALNFAKKAKEKGWW